MLAQLGTIRSQYSPIRHTRYDFAFCRDALRRRGITPGMARRGVDPSERLGRFRWIVERTNAWMLAYRRRALCFDRQAASVLGFLHLACALICLRFVQPPED